MGKSGQGGPALAQIRQARADGVPTGVVLGDAAYGNETDFRVGVNDLALTQLSHHCASNAPKMAEFRGSDLELEICGAKLVRLFKKIS